LEAPLVTGMCFCMTSLIEKNCGLYKLRCSHYMHMDCLEQYINTLNLDISNSITNHERLPLRKLCCPFCSKGSLFEEVDYLPLFLSKIVKKMYRTVQRIIVKSLLDHVTYNNFQPAIEVHKYFVALFGGEISLPHSTSVRSRINPTIVNKVLYGECDIVIYKCATENCKSVFCTTKGPCNQPDTKQNCFSCIMFPPIKKWRQKRVITMCDNCEACFEYNYGCSHMICPNCSYEFCYVCGGKYNGWLTTQNNFGPNIPFCQKNYCKEKNLQSNLKRYGMCMCRERCTIGIVFDTMLFVEGFGYENLAAKFVC